MGTPYWGELPGPKIAKYRRRSDEHPQTQQQQQQQTQSSVKAPPPDHNPNLSATVNRASVQTATTEANTESTLSPYASPTNSGLYPNGLAPRPPSYQRPIAAALADSDAAADPAARGSRRHGRNPGEIDQETDPSDLPEAQRGPPLSYRQPHTESSKAPASADSQAASGNMDYTDAYASRHDGSYRSHEDSGASAEPSKRASERRKKSTLQKSPLQRLELTLDSMTKEEKRARVEAAERRARERASQKASGEVPSSSHQDTTAQPRSSQNRGASLNYGDSRQAAAAAPTYREPTSSRRAPAFQEPAPEQIPERRNPHVEDRSYAAPSQHNRQYQSAAQPLEPSADVPRRNLSFRERAARNEFNPSGPDRIGDQPRRADTTGGNRAGGGGFSLTRSGSNKLQKEAPVDIYAQRREEAERKWAIAHGQADPATQAPPPTRAPLSQRARDTEPPTEPLTTHRSPAAANTYNDREPRDDIQGIQRRATEPVGRKHNRGQSYFASAAPAVAFKQEPARQEPEPKTAPAHDVAAQRRVLQRRGSASSSDSGTPDSDGSSESPKQHRISNMFHRSKDLTQPGKGRYQSPKWLEEWKKAPVGLLGGPLLTMSKDEPQSDKYKAWWEGGNRRPSQTTGTRYDSFEGEYEDMNGPTRFKPPLFLECGPLLRYCGMRQDTIPSRSRGAIADREIWRGSIMMVTRDAESSYDTVPTLRMFVQDMELLPTPPHQVNGDLSPEYVDPIAGHPKLGRRGETLYVRPVEHLDEGVDLSLDETDEGLFENSRSAPDAPPTDGSADYPGTFASRMRRVDVDGEKVQKFKDVKGFRLHAEKGSTFWRFNIEVELKEEQQRIAYRINRGPCNAFWVPGRGRSMNIMFQSCNGFSVDTKRDELSGPDPMWRDVLNNHQTTPFHVMIGGGNQIYNDDVADDCDLFQDWLDMKNPLHKRNAPFSPELQAQVEDFYFKRYCEWFSMGLFGLANSQIPMINIWSDRESFNGFGSYPHRDMNSPVLSGVGAVAFKYYMLFQHQSIIPETEQSEPSWILGTEPGPYVNELSRGLFVSLGSKLALLAADCRTERTEDDVIDEKSWRKITDRLYSEVRRGQIEHLLVVFPIPMAFPRLAWLENVIKSRAMNPVKVLGRKGLLGNALNNLDGGSEVMDDLRDHWTAKNHKEERSIIIEDLQDLAIDKSLRVTILSGDVSMAAVGQFFSNPKLGLAKHKDPRYMPNIISSAIANAPPPDIMADALNRRHKVHHFDKQTDESMIPMFQHGVDGKPRNNKRLLPHRNWCSIRQWVPGHTPPPTPPPQEYERSQSPPPSRAGAGGLLRRLSLGDSSRPNMSKDSVRGSRPPVAGGGLFRTLSRSLSRRNSTGGQRPAKLTRAPSWDRNVGDEAVEGEKRGFFSSIGRRLSQRGKRPDDGGINGSWGAESEDDYDEYDEPRATDRPRMGLRGGAAHDEYSDGDDSYFTAAPPRRANTLGSQPTRRQQQPMGGGGDEDDIPPQALKPFTRTPTGLTTKQMRKADAYEVDLEGGLDICLNVEVNAKDPTGITVPYRLLVPKLFYEYTPEADDIPISEPSGFKRLLSFRKKQRGYLPRPGEEEDSDRGVEAQEPAPQREQHYQAQRW